MLARFEANKWFKIDLIIDWNEQRVSVYIDDKGKKSEAFFTQRKTKLESANALSIYGLSPGSVSLFRDIRVCEKICEKETQDGKEFKYLSGAMFGINTALSLLTGLSVLFALLV